MSDRSKIEWTDATWNPIRARNRATGKVGHWCAHVSEGCRNCYAERMQPRFGNPVAYKAQDRDKVELFLDPEVLRLPLRWKKPRRIFVCSMTDLFLEDVPLRWVVAIWAIMALCPQHHFQVLTKRSRRMRYFLTDYEPWDLINDQAARWRHWDDMPELDGTVLPNVSLGVSAEDQKTANERLPDLVWTPAALRFLSAEPLLGRIDLRHLDIGDYEIDALAPPSWRECWEKDWSPAATGEPFEEAKEAYMDEGGVWPPTDARPPSLDQVIVGGESGPGARPMHPDWARQLRDQCTAAETAFFFKQWGEWLPDFEKSPKPIEDDPAQSRFACCVWDDRAQRFEATNGHWTDSEQWATASNYWEPEQPMRRVGKKAAGRLLDGVEHNGLPAEALAKEGMPA